MSIANLLNASAPVAAQGNDLNSRIAAGKSVSLPLSAGEKLKIDGSVSSVIKFRKDKDGNKQFEENAIVFYPALPSVDDIVNSLGAELLTKIINDIVISKYDELARDAIVDAGSLSVDIDAIHQAALEAIKADYSGSTGRKSSMPTAEELESLFGEAFAKPLAVVATSKGITDNVKLANLLAAYMNLFKDLFSRKGSSLNAQAMDQLVKMSQLDGVPAEATVMILERIKAIEEAKEKKAAKNFDLL